MLRFWNGSGTTVEGDNVLPNFKNPDYLAEIKRVKVRMTPDPHGNEVAGTLELIDTKGTRVCSERTNSEEEIYWLSVQGDKDHPYTAAHLNFLRNLDGRSVEILCIDGCLRGDGVAAWFLQEALDF